ncbi:MAG: hypothetical protein QW416_06360 [Candidatus Nitrosocaldaceae archaeon]
MSYSDYEIKRIAELREWLDSTIKEKESEIENLRFILTLVDNILKSTSFKPAVVLSEEPEIRQLRSKDDTLLANAYIDKDKVSIVPVSDIRLSQNIPPFQSFFINRILDSMKNKDLEKINEGKLEKGSLIDYKVEEENGIIKSIVIKNYREKNRLNEILNACEWVFTKMIEKVR